MTDKQITKEMTIKAALELKPEVAAILMGKGMHCLGCVIAHGETVEQAAAVHGLDVDALVKELNGEK